MPRLTDTRIRNLKPTGKRYVAWDANGLGVRVGTSGKKSFVYTYREGPKVRWMTLGTYPQMTVAEAREKHGRAMAAHEKGLSPADAELEAKRESRAAITVAGLVDYYLERHAKRQKQSWREDERMLMKDVVPRIGHRKAREIRRREIIDLVEDIADRGAPVAANRTLQVIAMYNAVTREYLINFKQDGKLIDSRIARTREELEQAMTRFDKLTVFHVDDVKPNPRRRALVRARAELGSKTMLLIIPTRIETDWVKSEKFSLPSGQP